MQRDKSAELSQSWFQKQRVEHDCLTEYLNRCPLVTVTGQLNKKGEIHALDTVSYLYIYCSVS